MLCICVLTGLMSFLILSFPHILLLGCILLSWLAVHIQFKKKVKCCLFFFSYFFVVIHIRNSRTIYRETSVWLNSRSAIPISHVCLNHKHILKLAFLLINHTTNRPPQHLHKNHSLTHLLIHHNINDIHNTPTSIV